MYTNPYFAVPKDGILEDGSPPRRGRGRAGIDLALDLGLVVLDRLVELYLVDLRQVFA